MKKYEDGLSILELFNLRELNNNLIKELSQKSTIHIKNKKI